MANESIIQVPPNVGEPIVLQRFLLRLVEELDILLGKRGASTNDEYVAQKELVTSAKTITTAIADAQARLEAATDLIDQTLENAREDLDKEIDDIKTVNDAQTADIDKLKNFSWFRPFTVAFPGRSTDGAVTPSLEYNIASVTRNGAGVYDVVLTEAEDSDGNLLLDQTQHVVSYDIADSTASQHYTVNYSLTSAAAGTFTVSVFSVEQGAGNKLVYVPYDPLNTDNVNVIGMYTPTTTVLP
jgi:hypothetical protein